MKTTIMEKEVIVYLEGRIDTSNAPEIENELIKLQCEHAGKKLVLDAEKLEYISSAGLRVLMKLRKLQSELTVKNVKSEVYEIMEMTGFSEILNIEKALRKVSIDGCELLGKGGHGAVYKLDEETIIKVYTNPEDFPLIEKERKRSKTAFVNGISTAIAFDKVRVGDCYGLVFELAGTRTLSAAINENPEKLPMYAAKYAKLLKNLHAVSFENESIESIKDQYLGYVDIVPEFNEEEKDKLRQMIRYLPDRRTLVHGDFHPKNIMVQNNDELLLIDMADIMCGHPVIDFGGIVLLMGLTTPEVIEKTVGLKAEYAKPMLDVFYGTYFEGLTPEEIQMRMKVASLYGLLKMALASAIGFDEKTKRTSGPRAAIVREKLLPAIDFIPHMTDFTVWE